MSQLASGAADLNQRMPTVANTTATSPARTISGAISERSLMPACALQERVIADTDVKHAADEK
jgi:hypothetical protein